MARPVGWKDLSLGIVAAGVVVIAAAAVLVFGRVGILHGKKFTIYITTDAARGIIRGSDVWLAGQKVGVVSKIVFRPPTVAPKERLVLELSVLEHARPHIRANSRVAIRSGGTLIGDQVVYLTAGDTRARGVADGDTIHGGEQSDLEEMTSEAAVASREFPAIIENVKLLAAQLQTAQGTLGALGVDQESGTLSEVRARSTRLMNRLSDSHSALGMVMQSTSEVRARADRAMAEMDSIRTLLASNEYSLGRFRRDSTLVIEITHVRGELAAVQELAVSPAGTIGRLRTDSALVRNVHRDLASLDSLFADMKRHPLRYIAF